MYSEHESAFPSQQSPSGLKGFLRRLMPNAPSEQSRNDRHRWVICDRYLPRDENLRIVEIGCAPGVLLLSYHKRYRYEPWGIDYSHTGVAKARQLFRSASLNPGNIVEADFFAQAVTEKFGEFFDVVTSHGFIEHFDQPTDVVRRHVNLLRVGGFLVVSIPNLRGFNYLRVRMSCPEKLVMHNLAIMKLPVFRSIFKDPGFGLETLFVGWVGTITLRHLYPDWLPDFDAIIDKALWFVARDRHFETALFSPHLMYIGRRLW